MMYVDEKGNIHRRSWRLEGDTYIENRPMTDEEYKKYKREMQDKKNAARKEKRARLEKEDPDAHWDYILSERQRIAQYRKRKRES